MCPPIPLRVPPKAFQPTFFGMVSLLAAEASAHRPANSKRRSGWPSQSLDDLQGVVRAQQSSVREGVDSTGFNPSHRNHPRVLVWFVWGYVLQKRIGLSPQSYVLEVCNSIGGGLGTYTSQLIALRCPQSFRTCWWWVKCSKPHTRNQRDWWLCWWGQSGYLAFRKNVSPPGASRLDESGSVELGCHASLARDIFRWRCNMKTHEMTLRLDEGERFPWFIHLPSQRLAKHSQVNSTIPNPQPPVCTVLAAAVRINIYKHGVACIWPVAWMCYPPTITRPFKWMMCAVLGMSPSSVDSASFLSDPKGSGLVASTEDAQTSKDLRGIYVFKQGTPQRHQLFSSN